MNKRAKEGIKNCLKVWGISLSIFFISLYIWGIPNISLNENLLMALVTCSFFTGVSSFILLIYRWGGQSFASINKRMVNKTKKIIKKKFKTSKSPYFSNFKTETSLSIMIILLLISVGFLYANDKKLTQEHKTYKSSIPSTNLKITPNSTPKPTVPTKKSTLINCNIHINCGGGTKQMTQSECVNSTCCQIGDRWYLYSSSNKCNEDQAEYAANNKYVPSNVPTRIPSLKLDPGPINTDWVPQNQYPECTIYYPTLERSETYIHLSPEECQQEQNKANSYAETATDNTQSNYETCLQDCVTSIGQQIEAGFFGDPEEELSDYEYSQKEALINALIKDCKRNCN